MLECLRAQPDPVLWLGQPVGAGGRGNVPLSEQGTAALWLLLACETAPKLRILAACGLGVEKQKPS